MEVEEVIIKGYCYNCGKIKAYSVKKGAIFISPPQCPDCGDTWTDIRSIVAMGA